MQMYLIQFAPSDKSLSAGSHTCNVVRSGKGERTRLTVGTGKEVEDGNSKTTRVCCKGCICTVDH